MTASYSSISSVSKKKVHSTAHDIHDPLTRRTQQRATRGTNHPRRSAHGYSQTRTFFSLFFFLFFFSFPSVLSGSGGREAKKGERRSWGETSSLLISFRTTKKKKKKKKERI
jgi:hypothetical protein